MTTTRKKWGTYNVAAVYVPFLFVYFICRCAVSRKKLNKYEINITISFDFQHTWNELKCVYACVSDLESELRAWVDLCWHTTAKLNLNRNVLSREKKNTHCFTRAHRTTEQEFRYVASLATTSSRTYDSYAFLFDLAFRSTLPRHIHTPKYYTHMGDIICKYTPVHEGSKQCQREKWKPKKKNTLTKHRCTSRHQ